jgi:YVTN family beta-propeller protein
MKRFWLVVSLLSAGVLPHAQNSGRLLVLNKDDATLVFVDPDSGSVNGRVGVGEGPHELTVSSDGRYAFASNYGTGPAPGHTLSMIDIRAKKELRRIDVSPLQRPHGLAFANGKLYFTAEANKKIGRYDPEANKIDWEFETGQNGTHMVLPSRDARMFFTSNISSNNVSAIQQAQDGSWKQTLIAVGKGPEGIDLSPDGKTVWSAHSGDGGVSVIDASTYKVLYTIDAGTKRSNRIKLTPDGKLALLSDLEAGNLVVLDSSTRNVLRRMALGRSPEGVLIRPGGEQAFVAVNGDNHVAVVDLKSWQVVRKLATGTGPDGMAWVP